MDAFDAYATEGTQAARIKSMLVAIMSKASNFKGEKKKAVAECLSTASAMLVNSSARMNALKKEMEEYKAVFVEAQKEKEKEIFTLD